MNTYHTKRYRQAWAQISVFAPRDGGSVEAHAMLHVADASLPFAMQLAALSDALEQMCDEDCAGARPVFMRLFVSDSANQHTSIAGMLANRSDCAVSVVEQPPLDGSKVAMWVWCMSDAATRLLQSGLCEVRQGQYRHLFSASRHNHEADSYQQARHLLADYARQLEQEGVTLQDNCVRTWFFVHDVDNNYAGMVKARNEVFDDHRLTPQTHFIASTGIGGRHHDPGVSVLMDTYAVDGLQPGQITYLHAPSHLNRTHEYGVAFERGTSVQYHDRKHVFISGTASIDNKGSVLYPCDIHRQMQRMADNVAALLSEAGATWHDVCHAIVYLRDIGDRDIVAQYFDRHFPFLPRVLTYARVCRPAWLIEMECMAITKSI